MTFARRNRLTTHFSERIPVVKQRISVFSTFINKNLRYFRKERETYLNALNFSHTVLKEGSMIITH